MKTGARSGTRPGPSRGKLVSDIDGEEGGRVLSVSSFLGSTPLS
jgi:hypothetical protein